MSNDLFFIPLIADALQKPDAKKALQEAFEQIDKIGRQLEYKRGFRQFKHLMTEVQENIEARSNLSEDLVLNALIRELALQIISGVLDENGDEKSACLDLINSRPDWKREFDELRAEATKAEPTYRAIEIVIEKEGEPFEIIRFKRPPYAKTLRSIKPGKYEFRMETGRVIGEATLTREALLWAYAYPTRDLRLAADTGDTQERPTREIELIDGEVTIRVFPGIESGRLELEIRE